MATLSDFSMKAINMIADHVAKTSGECVYCFNKQMPEYDVCFECFEHPFRPHNKLTRRNKP